MRLSLLFIIVLHSINTFAVPMSGRIGRYPDVRGIRTDLHRYGLEAGVYSAPDGRRVSFLFRRAKVSRPAPLPLLLYLPGSGEVGTDLSRQFSQRTIFERVCSPVFQMNHPCHFLALSPPEGVTTLLGGVPGHPTADQGLLMSAVDAVVASCAHPPVDTNRLYATGLSFGGNGVYALASRFPGRFAALLLAFAPFRRLFAAKCADERGLRAAAVAACSALVAFVYVLSLSRAPDFDWHLSTALPRLLWIPSLLLLVEIAALCSHAEPQSSPSEESFF